MGHKIVFLKHAERDLKELKNYIIKNFSRDNWNESYRKIKNSVQSLESFPLAGSIPPAFEDLNLSQYRQIISGLNRIIYEVRDGFIYIHIVCDARRDLKNLLSRRLLIN